MSLSNWYFSGGGPSSIAPLNLSDARSTTAGGEFMAMLGSYQFSLDTAAFQTLSRETQYRWAAQERIGRPVAQQFIGLGEDTISIAGTIYPHFRGGLGQLALMREAAAKGEPLPLVYPFERAGQYNGLWCIKSISDERSVPIRNGAARKIDFNLSLVAYGEDADVSAQIQEKFSSIPASPGAGLLPNFADINISELLGNSLKIDSLVDIFDGDW